MRCLIVDDSADFVDAARGLLGCAGITVVGVASTSADALGLFEQLRPDVALVDINLKGEMAYALMEWLHERGIRIVVISGYPDLPQSLEKVTATLHKPFTATALQAMLQRVMSEDQAR